MDRTNSNGFKIYMGVLLGNKWMIFCNPSNYMSGPSKKGGSNAKLWPCRPIKVSLTLQNNTLSWCAPEPNNCVAVPLNMVHCHFTLSFKTHQWQVESMFPMVRALDDSQKALTIPWSWLLVYV